MRGAGDSIRREGAVSARGGSPQGDRGPGRVGALPGTTPGFERTLRQDELRPEGGGDGPYRPGTRGPERPGGAGDGGGSGNASGADNGLGANGMSEARNSEGASDDDMFADLYLDFDDMAGLPGAPSRPAPPSGAPVASGPAPRSAAAQAYDPGPRPDAVGNARSGPGGEPRAGALGNARTGPGGDPRVPPRPAAHDVTVPSIRALPTDPPAVPPPPGPVPAPPLPPVGDDVEATSRSDSVARRRERDARPAAADVEVQASAWSAASHPGRRRAVRRERLGLGPELTARDNDDRYAATGSVFVVADGLGGHPSGWFAADVACRTLVADLAAADLSAGWSDRLRAAIAVADLAVRRHGHGQAYEGMRTTVVAAVVQDGRLHLAGCGDSVCWLIRGGTAFRLTEQGNAAELGRPWLLTSTPLGGSQQPDPELQRIELHPGDRLVLATDGVGHLPDETVADLIHGDPFHAATTLTVTAVQSGDDDATAVVIECEALPVSSAAAAPPRSRSDGPEDSPGDG